LHTQHLRKQLAHAKDIVLTCKPAVRVDLLSRVGYRYHYLETRQLFSLRVGFAHAAARCILVIVTTTKPGALILVR
jgi:hypothetical protein